MSPPDPSILTYPIFKGALLAIVAQWSHPTAARVFKLSDSKSPPSPGVPPFPSSIFHIPWIAYLPSSYTVGLTVPPDILIERTPDGGLLMIAAETTLDMTNLEHMKRSRTIAEIMIERTGQAGH